MLLRSPALTAPSLRCIHRRPALTSVCRRSIQCRSNSNKDDVGPDKFQHPELGEHVASSGMVPDALPAVTETTDWREFRARLVASAAKDTPTSAPPSSPSSSSTPSTSRPWAHAVPQPEKGCLLLAHPMMFHNSQEYFFQSVILLLEHSSQGSYGIILNRPTLYTLGSLQLTAKLPEFDTCKVYVGGDVGGGEVHMLHTRGDLQGAVEVVKGLYLGGIEAARNAVATGRAQPSEFKWYAKYAGWGPGQLEKECKSSVWFTAAASADVVVGDTLEYNGCDRWHEVLLLMGGDYAELSMNVRAAEARKKGNEGPGRGGMGAAN